LHGLPKSKRLGTQNLSVLPSSIDIISKDLRRSRALSVSKKSLRTKLFALKLCKQEQAVEESEVTVCRRTLFHTLINTCVENLIEQKCFFASSAQLLPTKISRF
jgi:hypothetical protein